MLLYIFGNLTEVTFPDLQSPKGFRYGIVRTRWNETIVSSLTEGCISSLRKCGVQESDIVVYYVPGSFEVAIYLDYLSLQKLPIILLAPSWRTNFN
jgi:6,7-dimethyl-8-ribityllumazine synthase